ncbi:MAG: hypothetical protein ACP5NY_03010 [Thermocladium sp.]
MLSDMVVKALNKVTGKVSTVEFVNMVVAQLRESGEQVNEDEVRPRIVDELWELHKRGVIRFSDDLIQFEKTQQT